MKMRCVVLVLVMVFAGLLPLMSSPASASVSVTVLAPNGGEILWVGGEYAIRWTTSGTGGGYVLLYYSTDSGTTWNGIGSLLHQAGEQEYKWAVPDVVTTNARVSVVWFRSTWSVPSDMSDADFTITKLMLPPIFFTSPSAPTDLVAAGVGLTSIQLNWTDSSSIEAGFKIERRQADSAWTEIDTVDANVTTYTDEGLSSNTEYSYRVRAYNSFGNSAYTDVATAKTWGLMFPMLSFPMAPENLVATPISITGIELEWEDKSGNETGFKIERASAGSFEQIATVGANVTTYIDPGAVPGTEYEYRVRAYNTLGNSAFSNVAMASTSVPDEPDPVLSVVLRFYINQTTYYANDVARTMDTTPIIRYGRTLLPIRYVAENIGADVSWDPVERKAMVVLGETTIELWLNQNQARINGSMVPIDATNPDVVPISIPPGRTMLPLRFVAEALGAEVQWDSGLQEARVTYPAP